VRVLRGTKVAVVAGIVIAGLLLAGGASGSINHDCIRNPASGWWATGSAGNEPGIYESDCETYPQGEFDIEVKSAGEPWRGWLQDPDGDWYTNGYHSTSSGSAQLESQVDVSTYMHAQVEAGSSGWNAAEWG
jgi:hypothetical protein